MKCRVCRGEAVIDIRRHNANFCAPHFLRHCEEQVAKTIGEFEMMEPHDRVLVAVSGGKDSLALWDLRFSDYPERAPTRSVERPSRRPRLPSLSARWMRRAPRAADSTRRYDRGPRGLARESFSKP